jgi:hypothetical protein
LIEVFKQDEKAVAPSQFGRDAFEKKLATRESALESGPERPPEKAAVIHKATKTGTTMVSPAQGSRRPAQGPRKLDTTRRSDVERPVFDVVRKVESGPRRYLQAIVRVTRETLRRTGRFETSPSQAVTPINRSVNSPSKDFSTTKIVLFGESPKTQSRGEHETYRVPGAGYQVSGSKGDTGTRYPVPDTRSEKKAVTMVYPRVKTPEAATRQVSSPPPRVSIKNVKTASRPPAPAAFPRPVNRVVDMSHARIQESFVQMPALMDEEKMNSASSVHLADLRPGKNQWPDLLSESSMEVADELAAHQRDLNRMRRLKQEQRGTPWSE